MNKRSLFRYVLPTVIAAFCSYALFSQTPTPSPVANQPVQKVDYSESVPYEPQLFVPARDPKDKKKPKEEKPKPKPSPANKIAGPDGLLTIPVSVFTSNDTIVNGLTKSDLKVFIGEEEQMIVLVEVDKPLNVVLMLDVSPSTENRIKEIKNIVTAIVEKLGPADKVMIVEFNANMNVLVDFTTDRKAIAKAISKSKFGDGTAIYDAVSGLFQKK